MTDQSPYPGAPRWTKWLGALALIAVVAFVLLHLTGHGFNHGNLAQKPELQDGKSP